MTPLVPAGELAALATIAASLFSVDFRNDGVVWDGATVERVREPVGLCRENATDNEHAANKQMAENPLILIF